MPPRTPSRKRPCSTVATGVGVVAAVGAKVTRWKVGERVFGIMDV
jgi:NADPH:quinone reductase-like Zn-dependent oxidoreductase